MFGYWFDFGDDWWHQISVMETEEIDAPGDYPKVIERIGESPPQYVDWDDEGETAQQEDSLEDEGISGAGFIENMIDTIPEEYESRLSQLIPLLDQFCAAHLNAEYQLLCRKMVVIACMERLPILRGKATSWAAGFVYVLGQVNFLQDPAQSPHMTSKEIAKGFGVGFQHASQREGASRGARLDACPY